MSLVSQPALRVKAHPSWYVSHSTCHVDELQDKLPDNLAALEGLWDFAVIRLAEPVDHQRGWAILDPRAAVPRASARIFISQHPMGVRHSMPDVLIVAASSARAPSRMPRYSFLHQVNTTDGSSGGPCFDQRFVLFGLHQGVWKKEAPPGGTINRGVPIGRIYDQLQVGAATVRDSEEGAIWELPTTGEPVIGCDAFQAEIWGRAVSGRTPIIVLSGEKGSGKTFRTLVQQAILPDINHLKITFLAPAVAQLNAVALAAQICNKAGAGKLELVPLEQANTTVNAWLKDEIVKKLIDALDQVRRKRLVWLTLEVDLDQSAIEGKNASDFLYILYQQVLTHDWLRIVLDGMTGPIPAALTEKTLRHNVGPISRDDIKTYLKRVLAGQKISVGANELNVPVAQATRAYQALLKRQPDKARPASF